MQANLANRGQKKNRTSPTTISSFQKLSLMKRAGMVSPFQTFQRLDFTKSAKPGIVVRSIPQKSTFRMTSSAEGFALK